MAGTNEKGESRRFTDEQYLAAISTLEQRGLWGPERQSTFALMLKAPLKIPDAYHALVGHLAQAREALGSSQVKTPQPAATVAELSDAAQTPEPPKRRRGRPPTRNKGAAAA